MILLYGINRWMGEIGSRFFFLMIRRPPRSTLERSSAASDVYKRQEERKANSKKGMGLENEFSYVDENGNVSSTPPDPKRMISVKREDIQPVSYTHLTLPTSDLV